MCSCTSQHKKCQNLFCSRILKFFTTLMGRETKVRSSHPEAFLEKGVLKLCSKFTGEHPCRSMLCNFIEIAFRHQCSPVNLLRIFRTPFLKNTCGWLLLKNEFPASFCQTTQEKCKSIKSLIFLYHVDVYTDLNL